ncbi:hypothetical protein [Aspergillus fumigatus RNA virus 1]|uniref:Uncharacterized protein n=1 Tax=Aspergillus fumigatus RNA virus 1 TaxID=2747487 RepID=A0AC59HJH4_9VIRU|nr:hypothetical protein [Aspergillus fumigatus RNA virus 1]
MTSRVKALSGPNAPGPMGTGVTPVVVTPAMVDRAADEVLRDYDRGMADQIRQMWADDPDTEVAQLLRAGAQALADRARFPRHARINANVPYVLTEPQMRNLIEWFPDFNLTFNASAAHDHGVGAAVRYLDSLSMAAEVPPGMVVGDFGGNELLHVRSGDINTVTIRTVLDAKDPAREPRRDLELRMIAERTAGAVLGTKEANSFRMARSILDGEQKFLVNDRLETFSKKLTVGYMSHVYDVPIAAIPLMMERCEMKMFLVTLHFSSRFFDTDAGELKELGARYTIDRDEDVFRFGFVESGAKWYSHKWSQFQRYGADQILHGRQRRYSYKIIKRRGDTITARVLEIGGKAMPNPDQYYRVPDVPCVRVTADLGRDTHGYGRRLDEVFPEDVWNRMVREAAVDFTRGIADYNKCVGNYSQITAGHSYGGQDAVLGTVPVEKIPVLVALSSASAAASIIRMRDGIRYGIDRELEHREMVAASLGKLSFKLFYEGLVKAASAPLQPILSGFRWLAELSGEALLRRLVEVEPVQQVRRIPADVYQQVVRQQMKVPRDDFPSREFLLETQDLQNFLSEMVEQARKPADVEEMKATVEGDEIDGGTDSQSSTAVGDAQAGAPSWMPLGEAMTYFPQTKWHSPAERKAAIKEEIEIIKQEASNLEAWFSVRWMELMANNKPERDQIFSNRDAWGDLDMWYVKESVISYSLSGKSLELFEHGGVYCPADMELLLADGTTVVTKLRQVEEVTYSGRGGEVQRIHRVIGGPTYTGWVIVNKDTLIHNGPLIIAGLQRALRMPMDYELGVYLGGPGCGKTYMINQRWQKGQQVMSPLVLSVRDVRKALVQDHGLSLIESQKVARTIDSWLCRAGSGASIPHCAEILSDEVFNGRAARAYAVWGLMRAARVVAYGDDRQIPPVDPSATVRIYKQVSPQHVVKCYLIYRYGPEVLAMIADHYDNTLRTVKPVGYTEVVWVNRPTDYAPTHDELALLTMYQAQKPTLRKLFPAHKAHISTTHEAQGKSVDEVFLVQTDGRMRPKDDPFDLYSNPYYINVGLSRVKKRLVVCNVAKPNLLNDWFAKSQEPRRVRACADVATAGKPIQFL